MQMRVADRPAPAVDGAAGLRGLSLLVQQVLGKPPDKTQQLSNWDRRPLGERQLVYAGGRHLSCPTTPHPPTLEAEADLAHLSCGCLLPAGGVLGAVQRACPLPPTRGPALEPEAGTQQETRDLGAAPAAGLSLSLASR